MFRALAIAVLVCLAAPVARAASLPELRAGVAATESQVANARAGRVELQKALDEVAGRIEALKARKQGGLFGNAELDGLLKRSQELSSRMTEALKAENEAEEALRGNRSDLVGELDRELLRLQARWDAARTREERASLVQQLKALRAEREALRRTLPATLIPQLADRPTDDPEALLERADALFDSEDKLRREAEALARRISELKAERELDRRMSEFLGEDALFDEHDRRIRSVRPGGRPAAAETGDQGADVAPPAYEQTAPSSNAAKSPTDAPPPGGSTDYANGLFPAAVEGARTTLAGESATGSSGWARDTSTFASQRGAESVGAASPSPGERVGLTAAPPARRSGLAVYSEDESLEQLQARQAEIRRLADETHQRALEAVKKARDMK